MSKRSPSAAASRRVSVDTNSYMTSEDEQILVSEILKKFDIIEKKTTDKSLDPQKVVKQQLDAWNQISSAFNEKAQVSQQDFRTMIPY